MKTSNGIVNFLAENGQEITEFDFGGGKTAAKYS